MTLKTLKDFGETCYPELGGERVYTDEELREEAIKHIKSNKIASEVNGTMVHDRETSTRIKSAQTDWIKYFFNITEEELKK